MKRKGVTYNVGTVYAGRLSTRPVFGAAVTRRELEIIRDDLHWWSASGRRQPCSSRASSLAARSRSASPPCSATHPPRPATLLRPFFAQASRSRSPSTACAPMTVPPARGRWVRRGGQQVVAAAPAAPGGPVGAGPAERRLLGPQRSAAGPEAHRNPWRPRRRRCRRGVRDVVQRAHGPPSAWSRPAPPATRPPTRTCPGN